MQKKNRGKLKKKVILEKKKRKKGKVEKKMQKIQNKKSEKKNARWITVVIF